MKTTLQYLLFTVCLLFTFPKTSYAQPMRGVMEYFTITAPDEVEQYENFWVVYSLKTKVYSSFKEIEFKDFGLHKISLPNRESYNEGHFLKTEFKYLIDSKKSGWITLPPQTIDINGHTIKSDTKKIFVKAAPKKDSKDAKEEAYRKLLTYYPHLLKEKTDSQSISPSKKPTASTDSIQNYPIELLLKEKTDSQSISPQKKPTAFTDSIQQCLSLKGNKNYKEPQFPYGKVACQKWLKSHIQYPAECESKGLEGTVYAQFIVQKDGTIGDITILKSPHPAFSEEVIRLLGEMPKWKPAQLNGLPIKVRYTLPIVFYFEESVNFKTSKKKNQD